VLVAEVVQSGGALVGSLNQCSTNVIAIILMNPLRGRPIEFRELAWLALGAGILGTGGGTHPYLELLNIEKLYREGRSVALVSPNELDDNAVVAEVGYMGAPLASRERLTDPAHAVRPVALMESYTGQRFNAVMPSEIGTANGMRHMLVAAMLGLPVVDADSRGRGFPEMQMNSFAIGGLPLYPVAIADIRDNEVLLTRTLGPIWSERLSRPVCTEMGAIAAICRPPRTGAQVKRYAVQGSVSRAIALGRVVQCANDTNRDPVTALVEAAGGTLLFRGKVVEVVRQISEGFLRGAADITGMDEFDGQIFSVAFQNEYTIARLDGSIRASVPDLICILDSLTSEAVGTETIRYGMRVSAVGLPSPAVLTSAEGLCYVGPRAFGYDFDYVPLHAWTTGAREI
jgi:DUF917 family protein